MNTPKTTPETFLASLGGPNLSCPACGQAFYSESANEMTGRPCGTKACAGILELLPGGRGLREA